MFPRPLGLPTIDTLPASRRPARPLGLFVTGTDTGAGKSVLAASLLAAMRASGHAVRAHKPVLTGLEEPTGAWPADHELLGAAAGMDANDVCRLRLAAAASPHLAARLERRGIELDALARGADAALEQAARLGAHVVVEGVGGLLAPLDEEHNVRDLARTLALPLLIAARPGLGTINHSLLTLEAARAAGLDVLAVVLTPWPDVPAAIERSNRETIERRGEIDVELLPRVPRPHPADLARAGATLPWRRWLALGAHVGQRSPSPARAAASAPAATAATSSSPITYAGIV